jgi:tRNA threonylcarbamoyladenosine biosynthesis protein TsaB
MKLLALDTATEACSAALYMDGVITTEFQIAPREHTLLILNMIDKLLADAQFKVTDLDAIAFGRGPGSFTGVRIATGVTHGLAFAADLPVLPVSTLASIAQSTYNDHKTESVLAGIDARMGGIYWGCYALGENGLMQLVGEEQVTAPDMLQIPDELLSAAHIDRRWCGSGSAWKSYARQLEQQLGNSITQHFEDYLPQSASIAQLAVYEYAQGGGVDAAMAQPIYLRNDVAKKSSQQ